MKFDECLMKKNWEKAGSFLEIELSGLTSLSYNKKAVRVYRTALLAMVITYDHIPVRLKPIRWLCPKIMLGSLTKA